MNPSPVAVALCLAVFVSVLIWLRSRPSYNPLAQFAHLFLTLNEICTNTVLLLPRFLRMWRRAYPATRRRILRDLSPAPANAPAREQINTSPAPAEYGAGIFQGGKEILRSES